MLGRIDIHKEQNISSFGVVAAIRRLLGTKRCGHSGTLDPMATGVLSVYVGRATTFIERLRTPVKEYVGTLRFGASSDTLDIWGTMTSFEGAIPTREAIEAMLPRFTGNIEQIPPMVSALKHKGKPLYKYAREGKEIERTPRRVYIETFSCLSLTETEATFFVRCSKGTYIRSLFSDLARELGTEGVMSSLCRIENDGICLEDCYTLEEIAEMKASGDMRFLREPGELQPFERVEVQATLLENWRRGIKTPLPAARWTGERILLTQNGHFIGTALRSGEKYLPEKVL